MANRLKLLRHGAVGFIDWLGSTHASRGWALVIEWLTRSHASGGSNRGAENHKVDSLRVVSVAGFHAGVFDPLNPQKPAKEREELGGSVGHWDKGRLFREILALQEGVMERRRQRFKIDTEVNCSRFGQRKPELLNDYPRPSRILGAFSPSSFDRSREIKDN